MKVDDPSPKGVVVTIMQITEHEGSLALQPEALVNTSRQVLFSSPGMILFHDSEDFPVDCLHWKIYMRIVRHGILSINGNYQTLTLHCLYSHRQQILLSITLNLLYILNN